MDIQIYPFYSSLASESPELTYPTFLGFPKPCGPCAYNASVSNLGLQCPALLEELLEHTTNWTHCKAFPSLHCISFIKYLTLGNTMCWALGEKCSDEAKNILKCSYLVGERDPWEWDTKRKEQIVIMWPYRKEPALAGISVKALRKRQSLSWHLHSSLIHSFNPHLLSIYHKKDNPNLIGNF